jgi:AcrR family transcriptional regulator
MLRHRRDSQEFPAVREVLLHAALEMFSERHFAEVRLADIAQRAGMSKANVYNHFRNKHQLALAAVKQVVLRDLGELAQALDRQPDRPSQLSCFVRQLQAAANTPIYRLMPELFEQALRDSDLRDELHDVHAEVQQHVRTRMSVLARDTSFSDTRLPELMWLIVMVHPYAQMVNSPWASPSRMAAWLGQVL